MITIPSTDLGAFRYSGSVPDKLVRTRANETELPQKVEVLFINKNMDYQQGQQMSQRIITNSVGVLTVQMPLVMDDDYAAKITDILLLNAWRERVSYEFNLPFKYAYLDPADVVQITLNGATHTIRINEIQYESPLLIKCKGVAEDSSIYTSYSVGGSVNSSTTVSGVNGPTRIFYLDIPLLRDSENESGFYVAATGYLPDWGGAVIYKSNDGGATYNRLSTITRKSSVGFTVNALSSAPTVTTWDIYSSVTVRMNGGVQLSSETDENVMLGKNAFLIGNEIVGVANIKLNSDGSYSMSRFLRGLRGTEWSVGQHNAGDYVIKLSETTLINITDGISNSGSEFDYKAVTIGATLQDTESVKFINNNVRLKPYAPTHLHGVRNRVTNSWNITWTRRTRYGGEWRDYVDVPIGEDYEAYVVKVYSSTDASTVVSTYATVANSSITISELDQISMFGQTVTEITVGIFQVSAKIGNGYRAVGTF